MQSLPPTFVVSTSATLFHGTKLNVNTTTTTTQRRGGVLCCSSLSDEKKKKKVVSTTSDTGEWTTGKVRAYRPIRGLRRSSQSLVRVQGRRKPANDQRMPPRVRITSGTARGRKLISPNVYLRPMMGKVREAVFSMLIQLGGLPTTSNTNTRDEAGSSVLDLFAGLGGVGLEALSRGVRSGVFVDSSEDCVATIRENSRLCRVETRATAVCAKVEDFLRESGTYNGGEPFSLITITPPYEEVDYAQLLKSVALSSAVGDGTFVVVEYPVELGTLPPSIENRLVGVRNRRYGRTVIAIYACRPSTDIELRPEEFTVQATKKR